MHKEVWLALIDIRHIYKIQYVLSQTAKLLLSHHEELIKEANRPRDSSADHLIQTRANTNQVTTSGTDFKGTSNLLSQRMPPRPFNSGHPIINDPSITYTS